MNAMNPMSTNLYGMLGVTSSNGMYLSGLGRHDSGSFAGEADVMMISGLGADAGMNTAATPPIPQPTLWGQLSVPVTIGTMTYPLYVWLILAALLGGAGGYYLGRR
jgi:hypothetical protein